MFGYKHLPRNIILDSGTAGTLVVLYMVHFFDLGSPHIVLFFLRLYAKSLFHRSEPDTPYRGSYCCSLLLPLISLYSMRAGACGVHKYAQYEMNPLCLSVTHRGQWFDFVTLIEAAESHTAHPAFGCLPLHLT